MERLVRLYPPILSALLLLLAFHPFNLGLLATIALTPWLIQLRTSTGRQGWRSGYLFGLVFGFGQLWWIQRFVENWTGSFLMGSIPYVAAVAAYALYFGLSGWLMSACFRNGKPLLIPLVWAGVEIFRSYIPVFAFPWGILATPLWLYMPLSQMAYFGSIFLVSAWCVAASTALAMMLDAVGPRQVRPLLNVLLGGIALSLIRASMKADNELFVVTVGQPGVDMAFGDQRTEQDRLRQAIEPMLSQAAFNGSQLLVLPEGVGDARTSPPTLPFDIPTPVPVLFGAQRSSNPTYQSAFAADETLKFIDKTRLVIFGEFVPGRGIIPYPESFRLPAGDLAAGTRGVQSLDVAGIRTGPIVCFEALFPDISHRQSRNEAQLLAVISVDDWYMSTAAPEQLRDASVWRSIETGLPLVRSASLGYTLATDDHGRIIAKLPLKEEVAMRVEMRIPKKHEPFQLFPLFPALSILALLLSLWMALMKPAPKEDVAQPASSRS